MIFLKKISRYLSLLLKFNLFHHTFEARILCKHSIYSIFFSENLKYHFLFYSLFYYIIFIL